MVIDNIFYQHMIKPINIIKVVKYITDMIVCLGDIIFKKLIVKMLITAILYISVTRFRNMHFRTDGNKIVKITNTRININGASDSLPVRSNYNIK